jgi:LAO/AO transport system kinase
MALAAPEAIRVLDASGRDLILVETVGVGQAEVEVATAADTTMVVLQPGYGDAIQAAKAGILEVADVFVVNKADREGAGDVVRDLRNMLRMGPRLAWEPPIVRTSTTDGAGIDELWEAIERHREHLASTGEVEVRRANRVLEEVKTMVAWELRGRTTDLLAADGLRADLEARRIDPYGAAAILLSRISAPIERTDGEARD